ncbi:NUT family member 2A [Plecturocebus cupreus]
MAPTPTKCLGSYVLNLFVFKFYWIYLNSGESVEAGHSLGPVLDFSYHGNCQTAVISTQPKGMASNEAHGLSSALYVTMEMKNLLLFHVYYFMNRGQV